MNRYSPVSAMLPNSPFHPTAATHRVRVNVQGPTLAAAGDRPR